MTDRIEDLLKPGAPTINIPVGDLRTDPRVNTRPLDERWIAARLETFSADAMGALVVSLRPDDVFILLDGQHRAALAQRAKGEDFEAVCVVHEGLSVSQEAALFRALNSARKVTPMQLFHARLTEGEPVANGILATVRAHGWEVDSNQGPGKINAVSALFRIYGDGNAEGRQVLDAVLSVVTAAWGHNPEAVNITILNGLGAFLRRHRDVPLDDLVMRLAAFPGGARGLLGDARGRRLRHKGSTSQGVAAALVDLYNQRRRGSNRLPEWR
ncbi:DUF6551 family protein [Nocardiopsis dassonvillei]